MDPIAERVSEIDKANVMDSNSQQSERNKEVLKKLKLFLQTDDFKFEEPKEYDKIKEKFEIIAIQMDIHKNGILYLKELVLIIETYIRHSY